MFTWFNLSWNIEDYNRNIAADGSTVIEVKYNRKFYKVNYVYSWVVPSWASGLPVEKMYKYEEDVTVAPKAMARGYDFEWDRIWTFTMPAHDVIITWYFTPRSDTKYRVEYYREWLDGNYVVDEIGIQYGTSDTKWFAIEKVFTWFTYNSWDTRNVTSGMIAWDESLRLRLYYVRNSYKVSYDSKWWDFVPDSMVKYGGIIPRPNIIKSWYVFNGWSGVDIMPAYDVLLEAVWQEKKDDTHKDWSSGWSWTWRKKLKKSSNENTNNHDWEKTHGSASVLTWKVFTWKAVVTDEDRAKYSDEIIKSYEWAYENEITTIGSFNRANPDWTITRWYMAKLIVNYVTNVLWRETPLDTPTSCNWTDNDWESSEIKFYAEKACALWVMWIKMEKFQPNKIVSRAEFGTLLSRILWWNKYDVENPTRYNLYYIKHLNELKKNGIMIQIENPLMRNELRKWIWVMLRRTQKLK